LAGVRETMSAFSWGETVLRHLARDSDSEVRPEFRGD
jgi:hypothetical protein